MTARSYSRRIRANEPTKKTAATTTTTSSSASMEIIASLPPERRSRTTRNVSPSTPTTRTGAPSGIGRSATARQISPCSLIWPVGVRGPAAVPVAPTSASAPSCGRRERARTPAVSANRKIPAVTATVGTSTSHETRKPGLRLVIQHQRAERHRDHAADGQHAVADDLHLGDEQHDREEDQQHAGKVDRQALEGEERQDQRDAADDAGQDDAGVRQLEDEPERAEHQEHVGDVRIGDDVQEPVAQPDLDGLGHGILRRQRHRSLRRLDRAAVDLGQQIRDRVGDEIDDLELQRFAAR